MDTLADTYRTLRRQAGYHSGEDFEKASGISRSITANIESRRKQNISREQIVAFCKATGASPYAFLPELDPVGEQQSTESIRCGCASAPAVRRFVVLISEEQ